MRDTIKTERRIRSRQMIESLIAARTTALSQYQQVMTYQPFEVNEILQEVLEDFCEALVDYTAKTHFTLYDSLDDPQSQQIERRQSVLNVANTIYPLLLANTQKILDFHDQYNSDVSQMAYENLESSISSVGELMADRISLEDELINAFILPENL